MALQFVEKRAQQRRLAARMLRVLNRATGWLTRADLHAHGLSSRECRAARQHSAGHIIFGQQGYKASRKATLGELDACAAALQSQIDSMQAELDELWKYKRGRETREEQRRMEKKEDTA
jgi:hypothetical protein